MNEILPAAINYNILDKAYILEFPKGIAGDLMKYQSGGLGTSIMANGKIIGHASLHQLGFEKAVFSVFSLLSIITGKYFLSKINKQLSEINKKLSEIEAFLYNEKISELEATFEYLKFQYGNYQSIMN